MDNSDMNKIDMNKIDMNKKKCSLCGETDHNKRTCPQKPIEDTFIREDYIEEAIDVSPKKEVFINDLLDRESYDIPCDLFKHWLNNRNTSLNNRKPCQLKEVRYVLDKGLNKESVKLYLELVSDIEDLY